jgi:hypothetical protein
LLVAAAQVLLLLLARLLRLAVLPLKLWLL